MNLIKIIKKTGLKKTYYSPALGNVRVTMLTSKNSIKIDSVNEVGRSLILDEYGKLCDSGETMLLPSKDNDNWEALNLTKYDRVLVRDKDDEEWEITIFINYDKLSDYAYKTIGEGYSQCILFEGNEELLGTTNKPS